MTQPTGGGSKAANPAPLGYLQSGEISGDLNATRDDMIQVFQDKTQNLKSNTDYYDAAKRPDAIGLAVPDNMAELLAYVGYPRLYVDSLADRMSLEGFQLPQEEDADDELWDWWQANDLDTEATLGHTEALIHGRAYITIAMPDPAVDGAWIDPAIPIIRVEPPTALYAVIDPRTRLVQQAIRVITDDSGSTQLKCTLYLPDQTIVWDKVEGEWTNVIAPVQHNLGIVPVVPITNRTKLSDVYGTSQITPELRSVTDAAARILMDMQGAAELMAIPQRLIFGIEPKDIGVDPSTGKGSYDAYMARILAFGNENGKATQFSAAELANFSVALDALDRKAASYTGLPPQYLSFSSQNPASAEAIQSSEARLVRTCERKNKIFGGAWEVAMRIAKVVASGGTPDVAYFRMESLWADPATPTYAAKADAATKLYGNGTGPVPKEQIRIDLGYSPLVRERMRAWDQQQATELLGAYTARAKADAESAPTPAAGTQTSTTTQSSAKPSAGAKPTATKT